MLPFKDNIPTERFPLITVTFIAVNVLVYLLIELPIMGTISGQASFFSNYGMTPCLISGTQCDLSGVPAEVVNAWYSRTFSVYPTLITSMFLHGGLFHLGGNMLFLWIFGNNVEDSMGRVRFVVFYLLCGLIASAAQIVIEPASVIPNVGASGAIAGVLGAYILLYPRARVTTLVFLFFFITFIELPAVVVLMLWFVLQLFSGTSSLVAETDGGVAYFAHIGGFVAGFILIKLFTKKRSPVYVSRA
ncbi:MAG: rhomboid family intramembrane serine protease [Gaiellales bacterium]|nr:MAG: rhomboid family intramembrane serine protease [Gaiellales bacterium]